MLIVAALLLVPLGLGYLTSWHMRCLRARLLEGDEECRQLRNRYLSLHEQLIDVRHLKSHYGVRRSRVLQDIHSATQQLAELRAAPARERLAA